MPCLPLPLSLRLFLPLCAFPSFLLCRSQRAEQAVLHLLHDQWGKWNPNAYDQNFAKRGSSRVPSLRFAHNGSSLHSRVRLGTLNTSRETRAALWRSASSSPSVSSRSWIRRWTAGLGWRRLANRWVRPTPSASLLIAGRALWLLWRSWRTSQAEALLVLIESQKSWGRAVQCSRPHLFLQSTKHNGSPVHRIS